MIEILRGKTWQFLPDSSATYVAGTHYSLVIRGMCLTGLRRYDDKTFRFDGHETRAVRARAHDGGTWTLDAWVN